MNINGTTRRHMEIYTVDHMIGKTGLRVKIQNLPLGHIARQILLCVTYEITRAVGGGAIDLPGLNSLWTKIRIEAAGRVIMHDYTSNQAILATIVQGVPGYCDGDDQAPGVTPYRYVVVVPVNLSDERSLVNGDPDDTAIDSALLQDAGNVILNFAPVPVGMALDTVTATVKVVVVTTERRHASINPWPEYLTYNGQPNPNNLIAPAGYVKDTFVVGHGAPAGHSIGENYNKGSLKAHGEWIVDETTLSDQVAIFPQAAIADALGKLLPPTVGNGSPVFPIQLFESVQGELRKILRSPNDDMLVKIEADFDPVQDTTFDVIQSRVVPADDLIVTKTKTAYNLPGNCPTISRGGGAAELDPLVPYYYAPELIGK